MSTQNKFNPLVKAVRTALLAGVAVSMASAPAVLAEEDDEGAAEENKVTVTGSRIKRTEIETASPVTVIDREMMQMSGITDVGDLLQSIPSMSGSPIGTTTNNGGNGSVNIDLRGMGAARTLTLVNGRRVVDGGDFQTIPSSMIERVEILKDGASAVYGADAVAGVVNIITRRDFTGVEVTAQMADWNNTNGGGQDSIALLAGSEFDKGHFVFGAEYVKQDEVYQRDTPWAFLQDSYYIYPAGCESHPALPYDGTPSGGCYPIGSSRIPESRLSFYSQGLFLIGTPATSPYEVGLMEPHDGRTYNYAPVNYLQTPYERTNIFAEGHFEISDTTNFYAEFRGNTRTSSQELAPLPYTGGDPMYDGFYDDPATGNTVAFTGISQDNYYLRRAVDAYNTANGTSLIYEPVVNPRRRMIETTRRFEQDITQYQWTMGFEGEFDVDTTWDVFYNEGHRSNSSTDYGQFSGARLSNALGPSADLDGDGIPECYADVNNPGTLIVGCVPLNMFGGGVVDAGGNNVVTTLTQDMIDYVSLDTVDSIIQKQKTGGANISGVLMELDGGDLGWSVGYAYWYQELAVILDSSKTIGAVTGNVGASTYGSLTNNAFYGEIFAPVMDTLNIKAGVRYDDWNAFDGDTTYQIGFEFMPMDALKLRATYGTVFRAPTISDLYGGQVDSFPTYSDPCATTGTLPPGCAQVGIQTDSQVLARVGGNPNLLPETGDTMTAGVVWNGSFGDHNFNVTLDYWDIALEEGISSVGVQFTLDQCYIEQNAAACALVTRNPDYSINNIVDAQLNLATIEATGIDTELGWNWTSDIGQIRATVLWTHLLDRNIQEYPTADVSELAGTFDINTSSAYADNKANVTLQWTNGDWSVGYLGEYISGMEAEVWFYSPEDHMQQIGSQMYHDIVGNYTMSTGDQGTLTISAGLTNVTDEPPPYIDAGFNGKTDPSTYRMFGAGYYLRLKWSY